MVVNILEEELSRDSLFRDESKLLSSYIPESLPFRENQLRELAQYFRGLLINADNFHQSVVILGPSGSGKTVLAKRFGYSLQTVATKRGINLKFCVVNCRKLHSPYLIILETVRQINPHFPTRGFSTQELAQYLLNSLEKQKIHLLLLIDEAEYISQKRGTSLFYWLTRSGDDQISGNSRISLIITARNQKFYQNMDESIKRSLLRNNILLEPYQVKELRTIVEDRAYVAFKEYAINSEISDLIARITVAKGDARYAIELLQNSGKIANMSHSRVILPKHVQQANKNTVSIDIHKLLQLLTLHQRFILQAFISCLKETSESFISLNELVLTYQNICREKAREPRKRTQIWHYVQELIKMGLITSKMENKNIRGRRSILGLTNISVEMLASELNQILQ